jgi:D-3-phosphoglycerate dehydrogenase
MFSSSAYGQEDRVKKKVLIPTKLDKIAAEILINNGNYDVVQDDSVPVADLATRHPDAYALIVRSEKVTPAVIDALPALKVIIRAGAGYDTIDTKYARRRGVDVMNTPGANSNAVAEEVVALMLADARFIVAADANTRSGGWEKKAFMGRELAGKTVGIMGLGNIGRLVAKRLMGFDCRLLGYDPVIAPQRAEEIGVSLVSLETMFTESDFITLHVPLNEDTANMVGEPLLMRMKSGATLINCARHGIIDEDALRRVKPVKRLRFLNDVYAKDEPGPKSCVDIADIMLPHLGASTHEANRNAARRSAEELIEFDEKGITSTVVNRDIPEGLDKAFGDLTFTLARLARVLVGRENKLQLIETSFYGSLEPFADWLLVPIVAAIWNEFDRSMDAAAARQFLKDRGIEYRNRKADPRKGFANSITIDMTANVGAENLRCTSVRGTVAENTLMISKIDEFEKLYFEPKGYTVYFQYDDRPGVVGAVGLALASAGINIEDVRHSHSVQSSQSLVIMRVNKPVPAALVSQIGDEIQANRAFSMVL